MNPRKTFLIAIFFFFMGIVPLQGQGFILQKDIYIAEGEIEDNVLSFGGNIVIKGTVSENVIAFGGTITIEGEVGDSVLGFGSVVILRSTAEIKGDVVSVGGTLKKESGVLIRGDTIFFDFAQTADIQKFLKESLLGTFGVSLIPFFLILKVITIFLWFILAIALTAIFPRQISYASSQIKSSFWPIFGTGLLSIIIYTFLIIFSALLSLVLIGIPILICLIIIGIVIKIFGRVILFYFFGHALIKAFGSKNPSPLLSAALGCILISFISLIPIFGSPLFTFVISALGWGVVIRTKFGNTENWFRRQGKKAAPAPIPPATEEG
jgi:cytoskeletal protein CcmA (bactofilin family)